VNTFIPNFNYQSAGMYNTRIGAYKKAILWTLLVALVVTVHQYNGWKSSYVSKNVAMVGRGYQVAVDKLANYNKPQAAPDSESQVIAGPTAFTTATAFSDSCAANGGRIVGWVQPITNACEKAAAVGTVLQRVAAFLDQLF